MPRLAKPLRRDLFGEAGEPGGLAYARSFAEVDLGEVGILSLPPARLSVIASGLLDGDGRDAVTVQVPYDPRLLGGVLGMQALVGSPPRLTTVERLEPTSFWGRRERVTGYGRRSRGGDPVSCPLRTDSPSEPDSPTLAS